MKKHLLLALFTGISLTAGYAQKGQKKTNRTDPEKARTVTSVPLSWGDKALLESEKLSKALLLALFQKPLLVTAGDAAVSSFAFTYAERGVYEDSVGNPLLLTDYLTEYCLGDTLSQNIKLLLPPRVKAGDTVYISDIKVKAAAAGKALIGRPVRIVILP